MSQQSSCNSSVDATIQKPAKNFDDLPEEVVLLILKLLDQNSLRRARIAFEKYREIAWREVPWWIEAKCLSALNALLKASPSIKVEKISVNSIMACLNNDEQPPTASELRRVKEVLLHLYKSGAFQFFDKVQLDTLVILKQPHVFHLSSMAPIPDNSGTFKFFAGQKNLTTLHLVDTDYIFKTPIDAESVPFKLKELALSSIEHGLENVLKFMKMHEDSLETVQLGTCSSAPIYEFVFAKLKKLKTLCLIVDGLNIGQTVLKFNPSVTTLKLFERRDNCSVLKAVEIIKHLPSVKNLVLPFDEPYEKLTAALDHLKQLKHLAVKTFDKTFWQDFTFPALESLTFFEAELDYQSDVALVAKNKNLKSLAFNGKVDNAFLSAISENFPNLVSLDLRKSKVNQDVTFTSHIRGLRLREEDFYERSRIYGNVFCFKDIPYVDPDLDSPDDYYWLDQYEGDDSMDSDY